MGCKSENCRYDQRRRKQTWRQKGYSHYRRAFSGAKIKGEVLPGGEDWQLVRPDGDTELYARYLLKTDDGHVIQVINNALIHTDAKTNAFYCKSVLDLEAPQNSPYDYLNHAIFIGTLNMPALKQGEEPYVIIGVYKLL